MRFFIRRTLITIPLLVIVTFFTYSSLLLIQGDPVLTILGPNYTPANEVRLRGELGLDRPFALRYLSWAWRALHGDFGTTFYSRRPVSEILGNAFPISLQLMVMTIVIALALAVPLGVLCAYRSGGRFDRTVSAIVFGLLSTPGFVLGIFMLFGVAIRLRVGGEYVFPAGGHAPFLDQPLQSIRYLLLPSLTMALGLAANMVRLLRTDMIGSLQEDYVLLAKVKGIGDRAILLRHALRPSSFTLVTVVGVSVGQLIGQALIIETLFSVQGIGRITTQAVFSRDYPTALGAVTLVCAATIVGNLLADLSYGLLDPRIRRSGASV